jgi:hypothetical protein
LGQMVHDRESGQDRQRTTGAQSGRLRSRPTVAQERYAASVGRGFSDVRRQRVRRLLLVLQPIGCGSGQIPKSIREGAATAAVLINNTDLKTKKY